MYCDGFHPEVLRDLPNVADQDWLGGDVLVQPAVDEHVADGGGHRHQVETEEWEVVEPAGTNLVLQYY